MTENAKMPEEEKKLEPGDVMRLISLQGLLEQSQRGGAFVVPSSKPVVNDKLPEIKRIQ